MSLPEQRSGGDPELGDQHWAMRVCTRRTGQTPGGSEILCRQPAHVHVIWEWLNPQPGDIPEHWEHGFACAEHWAAWKPAHRAAHELTEACGMPGSRCSLEHNTCWLDDDLPAEEPVRTLRQQREEVLSSVAPLEVIGR